MAAEEDDHLVKIEDLRPHLATTGEPRELFTPKRYSQGLHDHMVQLVREGKHPIAAAALCGIPKATFQNWMQRGLNNDPVLYQFVVDIQQAEAEDECALVDVVRLATADPKKGAEHAEWLLERRFSHRYAKTSKVQTQEALNAAMDLLEQHLEPDLYRKVLAVLNGDYQVGVPVEITVVPNSVDQE